MDFLCIELMFGLWIANAFFVDIIKRCIIESGTHSHPIDVERDQLNQVLAKPHNLKQSIFIQPCNYCFKGCYLPLLFPFASINTHETDISYKILIKK